MRWTLGHQIQVTVKNGGKDLIRVLDNGCGMNETDARFAVERHATSKFVQTKTCSALAPLAFVEKLWLPLLQSPLELLTCPDDRRAGHVC